jgi:hypothetical protein
VLIVVGTPNTDVPWLMRSFRSWMSCITWVLLKLKLFFSLSPWRWGGSRPKRGCLLYASILHIPQRIWVSESDGEMIYWQGKTEELEEKPVPVPLCPPQIPCGLTWASIVRGWQLTTITMARPSQDCYCNVRTYVCICACLHFTEIMKKMQAWKKIIVSIEN